MEHSEKKVAPEYTKPEVRDYGELRELTAAHISAGTTDVPRGTRGPIVFSP